MCHEMLLTDMKPFAINNAMVVGGVTLARKVVGDMDLSPSEYTVNSTTPGNGKQIALTFPQVILGKIGVPSWHLSGGVTSRGAGMDKLETIQHWPVLLIQQDEVAGVVKNARNSASGRGGTTGADSMLRFLTEAYTIGKGNMLPESTRAKQGIAIHAPAVNLVWTVQPRVFASVVSPEMYHNGTLGRFSFAIDPTTKIDLDTKPTLEQLLETPGWAEWVTAVLDRVRMLWEFLPYREQHEAANMTEAEAAYCQWLHTVATMEASRSRKPKEIPPCPIVPLRPIRFGIHEEAKQVFAEFTQWTRALAAKADYNDKLAANCIWVRACEQATRKALKLAAVRYILGDAEPLIMPDEAEWSIHAAEASIREALDWWEMFGGGEQQRNRVRIGSFIKRKGGWVTVGKIGKKFTGEIDAAERGTALKALVESGEVEEREVSSSSKGGAPTKEYRTARKRRKKGD